MPKNIIFSDDEALEYIQKLENPHKVGWDSKNKVWRTPKQKGYDRNQIAYGLDTRAEHNPIVYNYLKTKGRLGDPWLTDREARNLMAQTFALKKDSIGKAIAIANGEVSLLGYNRLAGMAWHGDPMKRLLDNTTYTGKAFRNEIAGGGKDFTKTFDAYYNYGTNKVLFADRVKQDMPYRPSYVLDDRRGKVIKFPAPKPKLFEPEFLVEQPPKTIYPLNNTVPESVSSWSGAEAPNSTPRLKDFQEVRQEDLNRGVDVYGDPISPFSLRLRLPSLTGMLQLNSPLKLAELYFADILGISDMAPLAPSLFPKLKDGKVPNDPYERFKYSLPDNQKNTPESEYNTRRYWELNGKPKSFLEAVEREMYDLQADGWHANSVSYNLDTGEYEFMKPRNHPTVHKELEWYNSDDAKEFRKKYKHVQPKNSNFDKYVPRYEDGAIPGLGPKKNIKPKDLQLSTKEERGLETAGPIEKALIAWLGGRVITGGLSMYNRARAFKQAKETYRQARLWNELTRDASRAWKIADADQIARNSLYSGSSEPLGWLYDTLLRPAVNAYDKLNLSPIGIILP